MPDWTLLTGALWLGFLTSISPCPLATNIAALAYLSRHGSSRLRVVTSALAYTAGRMAAYSGLAVILATGIVSAPAVAATLDQYLGALIGPGLIILGLLVTGLLPIPIPGSGKVNQIGTRLAEKGILGEFLMGAVFSLAFCPVSAALYFGGLLPTVIQSGATLALPISYGIGTAIPVLIALTLIAGGMAGAKNRLSTMQNIGAKLQTGTGAILLLIGCWITLSDLISG